MDHQPYSNREIDEFLHDLRGSLQRIENQTTLTNGRVRRLESWRWFMAGGLAILTVLGVPVLLVLLDHFV